MGHYVGKTSWWKTNEPRPYNDMIRTINPPAAPRMPRATVSQTFTIPPILGCLRAAEKYLGGENAWKGVTQAQKTFLDAYAGMIPDTDEVPDILKSIAHRQASVINDWLKANGYDIRLDECPGESFAVASILDVMMEWISEGMETNITVAGTTYPAVKIKKGFFEVLTTCEVPHPHPIVRLRTKGSERVYMTVAEGVDLSDTFGIAKRIGELMGDAEQESGYDSVTFPMIDYDQQVDISWLCGLLRGVWYVDQAVQQTKFRMNHIGARAQSAAAMMMRCLSIEPPKKHVVIDKPFLLWVEREGLRLPLFAALFAEDSWKNPGGLGDKKVSG